ncbi:hypothetical protein EB74_30060 [Mycobacterium sp. SWH-M5]|uniref:type VII secretion integral membrane protein EccD n=1 Tax=Mycolicibacterium goodii TaxID=134601 RepID=UPI0009394F09|nr:type VII secretion integral membrane protein EccD [Mycolicibacterium goodii]MBU8817534.1 type VII secretion integral membrane protein EccD [Mycolicibacterium goodii]OKH69411.1 hypothetical protein EB74_30060 [Mycobacterium sp. SWH-M5]
MSDSTVCELQLRIGEKTQVEVMVPANSQLDVVLGDLQPYLRTYLDGTGADDELPDASRGWRLRTPIGTLLDNSKPLSAQHVVSGTALELIAQPEGEEFSPRIERVDTAVARLSRKLFPQATPDIVTTMLLSFAAVMLSAALLGLLVMTFQTRSWTHIAALLACVAVIAAIAVTNARGRKRRDVTNICSIALLLFAPVSVSLVLPASFGPWGAPHLLVAAVVTAALAWAYITAGRHVVAYTAVASTAIFVAISQVASVSSMIPSPAMTYVLLWLLVIVLGRVELIAPRLARLPLSMFPSGSGRFIGRRVGSAASNSIEPTKTAPPDPAALLDKAVRANEYLTGLLIGLAVSATALVAVIAASHPRDWAWFAVAVGVPMLFAYRTWSCAGRRNVLCLLLGVFGPALALCGVLVAERGWWWGAGLAAIVAALALLAPFTVPTDQRPQSPLVRGARTLSEYFVIAAVLLGPMLLLRIPQMVYNRVLF